MTHDSRDLDATIANVRTAADYVVKMLADITIARDAFAAAPEGQNATKGRQLATAKMHMRAEAAALAHVFAALAQPPGAPT